MRDTARCEPIDNHILSVSMSSRRPVYALATSVMALPNAYKSEYLLFSRTSERLDDSPHYGYAL
jgi:hypothetical protein